MNCIGKAKRLTVTYLLMFLSVFSITFVCSAQAQALLQTGSQAPAFSLGSVEGKDVSLSGISENKVVLVFWSTWSANSKKALLRFEEFHRKYKDRGIRIVGINADNQTISPEDRENITKMVKDLGITFPVLFDRGLETFREYGIIALPSTVVIVDGKIDYELPGLPLVGTEEMFDYLLTLVGEKPRTEVVPKYQPQHDAIADANLARAFMKKNMNMMAYPLFREAIEKDSKYMLPYVQLGKLYEADGDNSQAEETLRKALSMEPENVAVMTELGYLLCKSGKIKDAVDLLGKAAKMGSYTPSHYYLAYALGKDGKMRESLAAFDTALSLNPFDYRIYLLRAETYENNQKLKEAAADYRKALELLLQIRS
jgi:Tfp pilus assembly protein PilF/peroxiredoxin